ncbi:hypothetical protein [Sphingosinicella sp. BN140058]|uniref:hypothetical protein n=1 Tax=Sphingosinicella sp. BN140058 TaxID=1892855 RepID=UPI001011DC04|nr:hypothetical protein [Sphingosinicella sp. BN140058]QAY80425.1 hypothetical protein ETR14_27685 [Sphingosinicella sp. BN140058]
MSDDDARRIDEARRALAARFSGAAIAPAPDYLAMATRQIDPPPGERPIETHSVIVSFRVDSPKARSSITQYLRGRITPHARPHRAAASNLWRFDVGSSSLSSFESLIITLQSLYSMGEVSKVVADGLYEDGLFVIEVDSLGKAAFRLVGDLERSDRAAT